MRGFALVAVSAGALMLVACSPQQKEADKLGFTSVDEMQDIQTQGWHTKSQYLIDQNSAARKLGFADFDEMQSARKAGYVDKASWDKHVAQSKADTPISAPVTEASLLARIDGKRWSINGMPCDLNGGTFEVYSKVNGPIYTLAGKIPDQGNAPYQFHYGNETSNGFVLTVEYKANDAVIGLLHDPNVVTFQSISTVTGTDDNHLSVVTNIRKINFDQMMNGNIKYDISEEKDNKTLCP